METWKQTDGFGRVREKVNGNFAASAGLLAELKAGKAEVVYGMYTGTGTEGAVPVELGFLCPWRLQQRWDRRGPYYDLDISVQLRVY